MKILETIFLMAASLGLGWYGSALCSRGDTPSKSDGTLGFWLVFLSAVLLGVGFAADMIGEALP